MIESSNETESEGEIFIPIDVPEGSVECCLCWDYFLPVDLAPVDGEPGKVWDVCLKCLKVEADVLAYKAAREQS